MKKAAATWTTPAFSACMSELWSPPQGGASAWRPIQAPPPCHSTLTAKAPNSPDSPCGPPARGIGITQPSATTLGVGSVDDDLEGTPENSEHGRRHPACANRRDACSPCKSGFSEVPLICSHPVSRKSESQPAHSRVSRFQTKKRARRCFRCQAASVGRPVARVMTSPGRPAPPWAWTFSRSQASRGA